MRFLVLVLIAAANTAIAAERPRLILQITVDQLRGDLPTRYYDRLGDGGFRYLWENGIVYRDAHHAHANTETIVGHTTLATGAHPSAHGMVGNLWFDRETGFTTYNVEDPAYRLLTAGADVDDAAEIDPTQRAARSEGRSPAAAVVEELMKFRGVSLAVSSSALRRGDLPDTDLMQSVKHNFHDKRSGDVFIVFEPNWFINDFEGLIVASTHGSPWQYDTYVPIVFAGAGLQPQTVDRHVYTVDIAPTLSALMNIKPPSGSVGDVLREVTE